MGIWHGKGGAKGRTGSAVELEEKTGHSTDSKLWREMKRIIKIITMCKNIHAEPKPRLCTVQLFTMGVLEFFRVFSASLLMLRRSSVALHLSVCVCVCSALCSFASSALIFLNTLVHWTYVCLHSSSRFFAVCTCVCALCAPSSIRFLYQETWCALAVAVLLCAFRYAALFAHA